MKLEVAKSAADRAHRGMGNVYGVFQFSDGECAGPVRLWSAADVDDWTEYLTEANNGDRPRLVHVAGSLSDEFS